MIDRNEANRMVVVCDECGFMDGGNHYEWKLTWSDLKDDGWRSFLETPGGNDWTHRCPTCADEMFEAQGVVQNGPQYNNRNVRP